MKWQRDCFGYEYMEGTSHIQFKNVFQGYLKKKFEHNIQMEQMINKKLVATV